MAAQPSDTASGYLARLSSVVLLSITRLVRAPTHSRRADAARSEARRTLVATAVIAAGIVALMFVVDAPVIELMPSRGTASLWPVKIITDFGKAAYVLYALAAVLCLVVAILARLRGTAQAILIAIGTRLQFVFVSVLASVVLGEIIKGIVGRGRPFVGGKPNPFTYHPFMWSEAYASFPSGHAITCVALALAVSWVWPRLRVVMFAYAVVIIVSRLVLLAHHPSDVVAGMLVAVVATAATRYWFAARKLGFTIRQDGRIMPLHGPSFSDFKRVAGAAIAPYEAPNGA